MKNLGKGIQMKRMLFLSSALGAVLCLLLLAGSASAGQIACDPSTCGWSISVTATR